MGAVVEVDVLEVDVADVLEVDGGVSKTAFVTIGSTADVEEVEVEEPKVEATFDADETTALDDTTAAEDDPTAAEVDPWLTGFTC